MMCALISSRPSSKTWNRPTGPAPTITASVSIGPSCAPAVRATSSFNFGSMVSGPPGGPAVALLDQLVELAGAVLPLIGVGQRRLALGDAGPFLGQVGVQLDHVLLVAGHVLLGDDRIHRALGDADGTVDALVGIDGEEILALAEAVDRTDVHAVGVLAADAGFEDDVGHELRLFEVLGGTAPASP